MQKLKVKKFLNQTTKKVLSKIGQIALVLVYAEKNLIDLREEKSFITASLISTSEITIDVKIDTIKKEKTRTKIYFLKLKELKKIIKKYALSYEFQLGLKAATFTLFIGNLILRPVWADNNSNLRKNKIRTWNKFFVECLSYKAWKNYLGQKTSYTNAGRIGLILSGFLIGGIITTIIEMSFSSVALYICQDNISILNELNTSLQETIDMLIFKYKQSQERHFQTYENLKMIYDLLKISSLKSGIEIPGEIPLPPIYNLDLP